MRLSVVHNDSWSLNELDVAAGGRSERASASQELLVLVSDTNAGHDLTIEVAGLRDGTRVAFGRVVVTPILGREVSATVVLVRLACGAWCTEGASACQGDGVVVCERDADGCMRWSAMVACPTEAPFCSLGACSTECVDECAEGEQRCAGPDGTQQCGQADSDPCLDWLPVTACVQGQQCESGRCASACTGECELGAVRCQDSGLSHCGDANLDGCTEWGPSEPCASGESCEAGSCVPIDSCTDTCTANECSGTTLTQCGNYDLDPCLEPSPGLSCVPSDPCTQGSCTLSGCQSTPRMCDTPPAPTCIDAGTLRTSVPVGSCGTDGCEYPESDTVCPSGCQDGRCLGGCEGVVCEHPPSVCYQPTGTCSGDGTCTYAHRAGSCDDGDACTLGDTCANGVCTGATMTCDGPPAPTCLNTTTLRTYASSGTGAAGTCSYAATDTLCSGACDGGRCVGGCAPVPWTMTTVDSAGTTGWHASLALDPSGGVHVSYYDVTNDDLRYAYRSPAGVWTTTTVDSAGDTGTWTSIAIDSASGVHISYRDETNRELRYAYRPASGDWTTRTIDSDDDTGYTTTIAVSPSGAVHIAYVNLTRSEVRETRAGNAFGVFVDNVLAPGAADPRLAIDASGGLHATFYEYANSGLSYAWPYLGPIWGAVPVDSAGDTGRESSLDVDASGGIHISYYDWTNRDLRYAYTTDGSWLTTTVDSTGDTGASNSLAVDGSGGVHVSYYDETNGDLRYAHRGADGTWTRTTVDSSGDTGFNTSIAVDAAGGVHIAYYDTSTGDLRYVYRRGCP